MSENVYKGKAFQYQLIDQAVNIANKQTVIDIMQQMITAPLAEMEDAVRGAGLKNVQVQASLNAEGFYGACGYAVVERISFRCRNGVSLNALLMQKALARAD